MKRRSLFASLGAGLALALGCMVMVACNSLPTVQEQFNTLCPTVTADLLTVSESPLLNADQQATALKAHDLNVKVCAAGASVDVADAKELANTALPAVATIIGAIPPTPQFPSTAIALGLNTFGPLLLQLVEQAIPTTPASSPAASAPVAASS